MRDAGVEQAIKTASGAASLAREIDEIDRQRAAEYDLLSLLLGNAPDAETLARGDFEAEFSEQARFFERHLKPWAARMFADLEMSNSARFCRAVGRVGRIFMELESEAFALSE